MFLCVQLVLLTAISSQVNAGTVKAVAESNDISDKIIIRSEDDFERSCNTSIEKIWPGYFHNCFFDRKYKDGGKDHNNIVKRILTHSEECLEITNKKCMLKKNAFERLMKKIIDQMKDYATMYLEEIKRERDKVVDLSCIEELSYSKFERCLFSPFESLNAEENELKKKLEKSAVCLNEENKKCSCDAKNTFIRMVHKLFQVKQLTMPDCVDVKENEPEQWSWYDYIIQPIISVWNSIKGFFSNLFG